MKRHVAAVLLAFSPLPAVASASLPADLPACPAYRFEEDPLNPDGNRLAQAQKMAELERARGAGDAHALHQMGSLYRLGRTHPARQVDRDLSRAGALLSNAALRGNIDAMAAMAEAEMSRGEALSAMVWAQAHAHFKEKLEPDAIGDAYVASLLARGFAGVGDGAGVDAEIAELVHAFVATHGPAIEQAHAAALAPDPSCRHVSDDWPTERLADDGSRVAIAQTRASRELRGPGLAIYKLVLGPDGKVRHAMVVDSLPDADVAKGLRGTVERLRFNAVDASAPERVVLVPLTYGSGSVKPRE